MAGSPTRASHRHSRPEMSPILDSLGMWSVTAQLPEQLERAVASASQVTDLPNFDDVDHVVIMGMGG